MDTPRLHQNSPTRVPKEEPMQGFSKDTISKCPLLFWTPIKKPYSQPAKKDDEERHTITARANPEVKENLFVPRINEAPVHKSTCSTPTKTPFGTPSQLQAPTLKPSFFSANKSKHSVGAGGRGMNEDASIIRTPFRLLAGKNLNACLFSPSQTPRPIAFPAPLDKLASSSQEGHAKRVLVMPQELSPARRVPVKQKGSQQTPAEKESLFATPKASIIDGRQFMTAKSSRVDGGQFVTPKSSRVDNGSRASGQNNDGNVAEHRVMRSDYERENLERSAWLKRVIASIPQQSPFATPISNRAEHVLKAGGQHSASSVAKMLPLDDSDVKHGKAKLDGSELLIRALASMPQLSSPARRVPVRQKQNPPLEKPPPHHKEKQQSCNKKALFEKSETCKSSQRRKQTCQNEAGILDGKRPIETKQVLNREVEEKGENGTHKTSQHSVDNHSIRGDIPKSKGQEGNGTDKTRQQSGDNHANKTGSSKPKEKERNCTGKTRQQSVDNHANKNGGSSKPKGMERNGIEKTKQQSVDKHAVKGITSKPKWRGGNNIGKSKQQISDKHAIRGSSSKPKGKGGNNTHKSKQQGVDIHAIEGGIAKQHDEDIGKTCGDDSIEDKGIDGNQYYKDGKQHMACEIDVGCDEHRNVNTDATQLCGDDATTHQADNLGDNDRCQSDNCLDDKKQHEDSTLKVRSGDDFVEHYEESREHNGNDNGIEKHGHHDGNDEK